jgi:DNA-binding CsgD family transcriptional regulator
MPFDYTEIIDFLPDATFVIDSRGVVVAWNKAIEKMTGVAAAEIVGKGDFAYAIPFYGKPRPILIDMVEDKNPQLRKHYDVKVIDKNTLHAVAFVASAYGGKGAYLSGLAAPLYDNDGNYMGAVESIRDISDQKQVEETLRQRTILLEETNTALKILLKESAEAKEELEQKVLANVKELILPFISELEPTLTDESQRIYLETIKTNISEITSSFTKKLSSLYHGLTPREIQIADFIRQGKSNKEIAYLLKISVSAVDFHRRNLRDKLNIKGKKVNLRSFLLAHIG